MADAIVRLKVESQEYDSKLKRATDQMTRMEQEVRRTGASFAYADKEEIAFVQSLGQMGTQAQSAKQKMREYTDALTSLTATYRAMSDEEKNSEFGKAMAASIDQISVKAAQLKDIMADTNATIARQASDTAAFDSLAGGIGTAVAAFQTLNGAMQLFGVEDENAVQAIAKLQAAMAVTSGLTKIQNALQKQSAVMLGVTAVQEKAAAAATALETAAKSKNVVVTKAAAAAQKALNAVALANPYILLAAAIAAVGAALYVMSKRSREAEKAEEERLKLAEEAERKANETREAFVNASAEAMNSASRMSSLQTAYMKANSEIEKTGILKQAQTEFKKLGIECNSLTDAQTLLVNKGGQIIELMRMQGTVAALSAIRMEKFKESFNNLLANGYDVQGAAALAGANSQVRELDDQINSLQTKIAGSQSALGVGEKKSKPVKVSVEPEMPEGSLAKLEEQLKKARENFRMATDDNGRAAAQKDIDEISAAIDRMNGKTDEIPTKVKDAAAMWGEHTEKIADLEARLAEFQAMIGDMSLSQEQRDWASGMAESYQEQLDKMKGATEEAVDDMTTKIEEIPSTLDMMKDGVGAISTIGNAFNDLKGIGEDLTSAFSGEMDAWDALMTVFNSGISILQTVMGVMEAINTLTELGAALKEKNAMAAATEATAVVTGKGTETAAETAETAVAATATGVKAGEAAAGAGEAVSGIPIVGPILAVAAIAAVLGAVIAAVSKAKSAGKGFAMGGIVPGNSFSGDNLRTSDFGINSGELILNKSQQDSIAGQLQGNGMDGGTITGAVTGKDLILTIQNQQKSLGIPTISQLKG